MNKQIMEKFYEEMCKGDNYKTAQSVRSMLDDLVVYRRDRIIETFNGNPVPFTKIVPWNNYALFLDLVQGAANLCVDVIVEAECYRFVFWDRNNNSGKHPENPAQPVLREMGCIDEYTEIMMDNTVRFAKKHAFLFPSQEQNLYQYIREFNEKLNKVMLAPRCV
jgi:hypothetical protein